MGCSNPPCGCEVRAAAVPGLCRASGNHNGGRITGACAKYSYLFYNWSSAFAFTHAQRFVQQWSDAIPALPSGVVFRDAAALDSTMVSAFAGNGSIVAAILSLLTTRQWIY